MKMADGGYRPAYNMQFATATAGGVIVGVDVSDAGTDGGQLPLMAQQLQRRYGQAPAEFLVDGGRVPGLGIGHQGVLYRHDPGR